jgi:hypothetical protein
VAKWDVGEQTLTDREQETFELAILALSLILRGPVRGLIVENDERLAVIPRPEGAPELFRALGRNDWNRSALMAEEHFA